MLAELSITISKDGLREAVDKVIQAVWANIGPA